MGAIHCEVFHTIFLDEEAFFEYEALSYTWGGSDQPCSITLNGKGMPVTENLSLALRHLRDPKQDRILWIDALCIDQRNDKERGHQIRQMPVIYRSAIRVIIWLGQATAAEEFAMRRMRRLENAMKSHACNNWTVSDRRWSVMWEDLQEDSSLNQEEALLSLLNRSWFKRVWIIQEVTNARAARVHCGKETVSARAFCVMLSVAKVVPTPHCQSILDVMPGPTRQHSWWNEKPNMPTLLYKFRECQASDPRDHVYGLLGVSPYLGDTTGLTANYEKSEIEVVQDAIVLILGTHHLRDARLCLPEWTMSQLLYYENRKETLIPQLFQWAVIEGNAAGIDYVLHTSMMDVDTILWHISKLQETPHGKDPRAVLAVLQSHLASAARSQNVL
jgi:hypothetical protein